jgi:general secretion pathway protein A
MMLEKHFGFTTTPFTRELPVEKRLVLPFLDEQARALEDTIKQKMSALVMAPAGIGKSVILRTVVSKLPQARFRTTYFKVTALGGRDLCREVAHSVGAKSAGTYPALVRSVQERFEQQIGSDAVRPVLIFDDAHTMRQEGFELLKILTNYDMDSRLVVSFILAGHPSLRTRLHRTELDDIRQRIAHCGELRLLSRQESVDYIKHRIHIAGSPSVPFDDDALEGIYEMSSGNMRAIDTLALKSLKKAAESGAKTVGTQHLHQARAEVWV